MTAIENHENHYLNIFQRGRRIVSTYVFKLLTALELHTKQRRNRNAFMNLVGKESWVYKDIGVHENDVDWASRLPIQINAAAELEKIRLQNRKCSSSI